MQHIEGVKEKAAEECSFRTMISIDDAVLTYR